MNELTCFGYDGPQSCSQFDQKERQSLYLCVKHQVKQDASLEILLILLRIEHRGYHVSTISVYFASCSFICFPLQKSTVKMIKLKFLLVDNVIPMTMKHATSFPDFLRPGRREPWERGCEKRSLYRLM